MNLDNWLFHASAAGRVELSLNSGVARAACQLDNRPITILVFIGA